MKKEFSPFTKFLIFIGKRSRCCGAPTDYPVGWDRVHCSACFKKIG